MNKTVPKKINPLVNEIFPDSDLRHKYKVKKIIGKGQYGYVAKAIKKKDNQFVAIKKLINIFQNEFETKRILRQIILLKNCKHQNFVTLIEILLPADQTIQNFDKIYIVTEYCDSDLRKLFKMEETFLQIDDVKLILYQIASGIKYLHSASIIHRDLTPSNILINGQGMKVKICDLGLARVIQTKLQQQNQQNGQKMDPADHSSDEESKLESVINELSLQQKQAIKKQMINIYQNIDSQSQPGTPNEELKSREGGCFQDSTQFIRKRLNSGQIADNEELKEQPNQNKQIGKKRKKLKRMNTLNGAKVQLLNNSESVEQLTKRQQIKQDKRQEMKKYYRSPIAKLTLRVTTRWYRAPQIILLEQGYSKPIDIWSFGCLFGELLKMMKNVCYNSMHRFPLFPGKYCYPVSPATLCNINKEVNKMDESPNYKNDQLFMILSTIGKPNEAQMNFLTDETAKQYIRSIENLERKEFKKFFPSVPKQAVEILERTLLFDPRDRLNIQDILNHPFLASVRCKQSQTQISPIIMEFEEDDNLDLEKLKIYLANQIKIYL